MLPDAPSALADTGSARPTERPVRATKRAYRLPDNFPTPTFQQASEAGVGRSPNPADWNFVRGALDLASGPGVRDGLRADLGARLSLHFSRATPTHLGILHTMLTLDEARALMVWDTLCGLQGPEARRPTLPLREPRQAADSLAEILCEPRRPTDCRLVTSATTRHQASIEESRHARQDLARMGHRLQDHAPVLPKIATLVRRLQPAHHLFEAFRCSVGPIAFSYALSVLANLPQETVAAICEQAEAIGRLEDALPEEARWTAFQDRVDAQIEVAEDFDPVSFDDLNGVESERLAVFLGCCPLILIPGRADVVARAPDANRLIVEPELAQRISSAAEWLSRGECEDVRPTHALLRALVNILSFGRSTEIRAAVSPHRFLVDALVIAQYSNDFALRFDSFRWAADEARRLSTNDAPKSVWEGPRYAMLSHALDPHPQAWFPHTPLVHRLVDSDPVVGKDRLRAVFSKTSAFKGLSESTCYALDTALLLVPERHEEWVQRATARRPEDFVREPVTISKAHAFARDLEHAESASRATGRQATAVRDALRKAGLQVEDTAVFPGALEEIVMVLEAVGELEVVARFTAAHGVGATRTALAFLAACERFHRGQPSAALLRLGFEETVRRVQDAALEDSPERKFSITTRDSRT